MFSTNRHDYLIEYVWTRVDRHIDHGYEHFSGSCFMKIQHRLISIMAKILQHPVLGAVRGKTIGNDLIRFHSLPYASIPARFARSTRLDQLPRNPDVSVYDASSLGPCSIQIAGAARSDAESNQLPTDDTEEQDQDEDCLRLTITKPIDVEPCSKLPVVVFIHGGAFFLGSGDRRWLDPTTFCRQGLRINKPMIFVSLNYRLGLLGFLHSPQVPHILPANNALHDQIRGFEWIQKYIHGFGGDPKNVTAIGQSAGGESLSLHNLSGIKTKLYNRSITLSGTLVTMPAKTPAQYHSTFLECSEKVGLSATDQSSEEIARAMVAVDLDKIRAANFVGAPCADTEVLPYQKPSMHLMRSGSSRQVDWLESQIVSTCTYDGSISYVMTYQNPERKDHASSFVRLAKEVLLHPQRLLKLYDIHEHDQDDEALEKICLFESDIGFVSATRSQALGMAESTTSMYFQLFDLGNPFPGILPQGRYASHTYDVVALFGAYEDRHDQTSRKSIQSWRDLILKFIHDGTAPCPDFSEVRGGLLIDRAGVTAVPEHELPGAARRQKLWDLAWAEKGDAGLDIMWEGLCRRWLDQGG